MVKGRRRLPPSEYIGRKRYLLTFCCFYRLPHFADADNVVHSRMQILRTAAAHPIAIPAYCFMPDHLHLVVEGLTAEANLLALVKAAKQHTAFDFKRRRGGKLWQRGWHDRIIRPSDEIGPVVRYVVENPRPGRNRGPAFGLHAHRIGDHDA